jgi:hypothetical protein
MPARPAITYVARGAGYVAQLFEKIWDIGAERIVSRPQ